MDASRPVVSNTTPLIALVGIGLLHVLPQIYGQIWIPGEVRAEYQARALPTEPDLDTLPWLVVKPAITQLTLSILLDAGEAAAITLAIDSGARALLLDERRGRRIAFARGIPVVGTLGVLLAAKQEGLIPIILPLVDELIAQGRHISARLRDEVLRAAGE